MRSFRNILSAGIAISATAIIMCGCEKEIPSLTNDKNVIPPTRTFIDQTGATVSHNWIELPEVSGTSSVEQFATHYTTIGGRKVRNYSMLFDTKHKVALLVAYPLHNLY